MNETIQIAMLYSLAFNAVLMLLGAMMWAEIRSLRQQLRDEPDPARELDTPFMRGEEVT